MTAPVNDRLFDELLKPVVEDYYRLAKVVGELQSVPALAGCITVLKHLACMEVLAEAGDRTARVLDVAAPLWEDMRGLAGVRE